MSDYDNGKLIIPLPYGCLKPCKDLLSLHTTPPLTWISKW